MCTSQIETEVEKVFYDYFYDKFYQEIVNVDNVWGVHLSYYL